MLAYVKYSDNYRAVIPVRLINSFEPEDEDDFSKTRELQAHWCSENGSTEGYYPAFVHALADTLEALNIKLKKMREPFPRLIKVETGMLGPRKQRATEPPREELVAKLKATIEEQAKELKKLKRELIQAVDLNKRLTNALLEKIGVFESADLGVTGGSHSPPPMRIEPAGVSTESAQAPMMMIEAGDCLEKYISEHPMGPPAPPPEHRLASVRKHLRSFFTEAGHQGKRVRKTGIAQT
ncbi:hypothetical protein HPB49_012294 [Dermacentor silvarum]|uniref:Uncharacterized protein n=1 Tax=Dermacentor silvarum TaxID=543639 RepID=A0ACB8DZK2_DERSI|nr:hypothetical protein HPB49_012294 [Dermacentor silvarum]